MRLSLHRPLSGVIFAALLAATFASAQQPNRILQEIDSGSAAALPGSVNPRIAAGSDIGRLDSATPLNGVTIYFQPTAEQQTQLDSLVQAQQTPGSPEY
ncbi:MAG: hypothetical protein WAK25_03955, partial [Acidobacteriaceae bacterium]